MPSDAYGNYQPGATIQSGVTNVGSTPGLGYTIPISTIASGNPAGSTSYYFGADSIVGISTTYANAFLKVPKSGILRAAFLKARITGNGSAELVPHYVRINDTTDVLFSSVAYNAAEVDAYGTGLSQAVATGDTIVIKIATPAWGTPPTTVRWEGWIYIE